MISTSSRANLKTESASPEYEDEIERLAKIIEDAESSSSRDSSIEEEMDDFATSMFEKFGYEAIKRISTPYGKQYNLKSENSDFVLSKSNVSNIVNDFGFIVEEAQDINREINIFVPSIWRYLPFEHSTNKPNSELIIILYMDSTDITTHCEVCSSNKGALESISNIVIPDSTNFEKNTLTYDSNAIESIMQAAKHEKLSYSVYERTLNTFPLFEWSPSEKQEYVILERENEDDVLSTWIIHKSNSNNPVCGTRVNNPRKLFIETINNYIHNTSLEIENCEYEPCSDAKYIENYTNSKNIDEESTQLNTKKNQ